jgi:hypothetical protein
MGNVVCVDHGLNIENCKDHLFAVLWLATTLALTQPSVPIFKLLLGLQFLLRCVHRHGRLIHRDGLAQKSPAFSWTILCQTRTADVVDVVYVNIVT